MAKSAQAPKELSFEQASIREALRRPPIERIINAFSPQRANAMKWARLDDVKLRYEAAEISRERNWNGNLQMPPESSQVSRERVNMLMAARYLVENDPFVGGILEKYVVYCLGTLRYQARTGDDALDEQIEDYFEGWQKRCDITGRHNFRTLTQLALLEERTCGDSGIVYVNDPLTGEIRLQLVEGDCIGHPYQSQLAPDYVNGVLIDSYGRPTAYRVFQRNRLTAMYFNPVDVPANFFLHYFQPFRVSLYRGVSCFHGIMTRIQDRKETREAMLIRLKYAARQSALITTLSGQPSIQERMSAGGPTSGTPNTSSPTGRLEWIQTEVANLRYMAKGEDMREFKTDFPSADIQAFDDTILMDIANCLNLSFGFIRNMARQTGPAVRAVLAQDDREFARIRLNVTDRILDPVRNRVIFQAACSGAIKADPMDPRIYKGIWYFPGKLTIDLGRDTDSNIRMNAAGMLPLSEIAADNGDDWEEVQDQILAEAQRRESKRLASKVPLEKSDIRVVTAAGAEIRAEGTIEAASQANNATPTEAQA